MKNDPYVLMYLVNVCYGVNMWLGLFVTEWLLLIPPILISPLNFYLFINLIFF